MSLYRNTKQIMELSATNFEVAENFTRDIERPVLEQLESLRRVLSRKSKLNIVATTQNWAFNIFSNLTVLLLCIVSGVFGDALFNWFARRVLKRQIKEVQEELSKPADLNKH